MSTHIIIEEVKKAFPGNEDELEGILEDLENDTFFSMHASTFAEEGVLQNKDLADKLMEHAISKIEESSEALECAEYLANPDGFNNIERAKELMVIAIDKADDFSESLQCARRLADVIEDKDWAKKVFTLALDRAEDEFDKVEAAEEIANPMYLGDKDWAREVLKKLVENVDDSEMALKYAETIASDMYLDDRDWAKEVYVIALKLSGDDVANLTSCIFNIKYTFSDEEWAEELMKKYDITLDEEDDDDWEE